MNSQLGKYSSFILIQFRQEFSLSQIKNAQDTLWKASCNNNKNTSKKGAQNANRKREEIEAMHIHNAAAI